MKPRNLFSGTVLINGADTVTGYNAARSLAGHGFTIYGQAENANSIFLKSKYWANIFIGDCNEENLIAYSKAIMAEKRIKCFKPVLLLSQDKAVALVSSKKDALSSHFYFQLPPPDVTEILLDKTKFDSWARANNVDVPISKIVSQKNDLQIALDEIPFPLVIKPLVRTPLWDQKYPNDKAFMLKKRPQNADYLLSLLEATPKLIVQQWITGGDEDVYFVLAHFGSKKTSAMAGRKITQWPVLTGSTSMCVSYEDPNLLKLGVDILRKANYHGLGSVEFKKDKKTGNYSVTEPTVGRNDFQSYIATCSGINLNLSYVLDCLDYSYHPQTKTGKAVWFDELGYIRSLRHPKTGDSISALILRFISHRLSAAHLSFSDAAVCTAFLKTVIRLVFRRSDRGARND